MDMGHFLYVVNKKWLIDFPINFISEKSPKGNAFFTVATILNALIQTIFGLAQKDKIILTGLIKEEMQKMCSFKTGKGSAMLEQNLPMKML